MLLSELRNNMILPDKEIIINKEFYYNDLKYYLVSLTKSNDEVRLWVIKNKNTYKYEVEKFIDPITTKIEHLSDYDSGVDDNIIENLNQKYDLESNIEKNNIEYDEVNYNESFDKLLNKSEDNIYESEYDNKSFKGYLNTDINSNIEYEMEEDIVTNREKKADDIINDEQYMFIKEIIIDDNIVEFDACEGTPISFDNAFSMMCLQHFCENNSLNSSLFEVDINDLELIRYSSNISNIDNIGTLHSKKIKLNISNGYKRYLVEEPVTLTVQDYNEKSEFVVNISNIEKKFNYYINSVRHYNLYEETNKLFESDKMKSILKESNSNDEDILKIKKQALDICKKECPDGMDYLIVEYEVKDNITLEFLTQEYLNDRYINKNSNSSYILNIKPDNKIGRHGLNNKIAILGAVKKDYYGDIECEIFSCTETVVNNEILL